MRRSRPIRGREISIDLQLKATSGDCYVEDMVSFDLPVNNYEDLRDPHCTAPHFLVVLVLDADDGAWLVSDEEALLIRRCAYWLDLRGRPATTNKVTITVKLPRVQRFNVAALQAMMQSAYGRAAPREGEAV